MRNTSVVAAGRRTDWGARKGAGARLCVGLRHRWRSGHIGKGGRTWDRAQCIVGGPAHRCGTAGRHWDTSKEVRWRVCIGPWLRLWQVEPGRQWPVEGVQDASGDIRLAWGRMGRGRGRWGSAVVAAVRGAGCCACEAALGCVDGGRDACGQGSWMGVGYV